MSRHAPPLAVVSFDRRKLDGDDDDTEQWAYNGPTIKRHLQGWDDSTLRDERGVADTLDAAKLAAEDSMLAHARLVVETLRPWFVARSEPLPHLDVETLDPGIRRLVSLLREAGFDTCDSGDGSKAPAMECAVDVPMVAIDVSRESAIVTAEAVHGLLVLATKPGVLEREGVAVDLSYSPHDRTAIVVILGVSDADLKSGVAVHRSTR